MKTLSCCIWSGAWLIALTTLSPLPLRALDLSAKIEPLAKPLVEDGTAVGFVVGVVRDGETQTLGFGETAKGSGTKPDLDTAYEIGSVSKVFTGLLLADAVERGLLKLDDPVQKYLLDDVKLPIADGKPITLEHLATHTSGLPRMPSNFKPANPMNPYADYTVAQLHEFLSGHKLRRPPGEHEYSNLAMGLLGQVLARQAGCSYEELLNKRITGPLGMTDTRITLDDALRKRLAAPYNASLKPEQNWDLNTLAGAGGIRSTVRDMLKFAQANLDDAQPLAAAMRLARTKRHDMPGGRAIGLSWMRAGDGMTWWHSGMTGGYHAWLAVTPDLKLGTVVLSNTATPKVSELGEQITQVAAGLDVKPKARLKAIDVDRAVLATYVGRYELAPSFILTVTLEDGGLMVQATGQGKAPIFASSQTEFFYKIVDAQITFVPGPAEKDAAGKAKPTTAAKLILHQGGMSREAPRKE